MECTAVMAVERKRGGTNYSNIGRKNDQTQKRKVVRIERVCHSCFCVVFFSGEGNYNFFFFLNFVCVCVWQQEHSHRDGDGWNDCTGGQDLTGRCRRAAGSQRFRGGVGVGAPKSGSADFRRRLQLYTYTH